MRGAVDTKKRSGQRLPVGQEHGPFASSTSNSRRSTCSSKMQQVSPTTRRSGSRACATRETSSMPRRFCPGYEHRCRVRRTTQHSTQPPPTSRNGEDTGQPGPVDPRRQVRSPHSTWPSDFDPDVSRNITSRDIGFFRIRCSSGSCVQPIAWR